MSWSTHCCARGLPGRRSRRLPAAASADLDCFAQSGTTLAFVPGVKLWRVCLIVVLMAAGIPQLAAAQENNKFALGAAYVARGADGPTSHAPSDIGLIWRF